MIDGKYFDAQELLIVYAAMDLDLLCTDATSDAISYHAYKLSGNEDLYAYHASRFRASCENLLALKFFTKVKQSYVPTAECRATFDRTRLWMERVFKKTDPQRL